MKAKTTTQETEVNVSDIWKFVMRGITSPIEIGKRLHKSPEKVYDSAAKAGIILESEKYIRMVEKSRADKESMQRVMAALNKGEKSLERLCQISGRAITGFYELCNKYSIKLPEGLIPYRFKPDLDERIARGASLPEMAPILHETSENVRLYIVQSGQYGLWRQARKSVALKKTRETPQNIVKSSLLPLLIARARQLAQGESWAASQAFEYFHFNVKLKCPKKYQDLITFFARYEKAYLAGEQVSLQNLVEGTGIWFTSAGRILESRGLSPLYGSREKHMLSPDEQKWLEECVTKQIGNVDIAYFCGARNPAILTSYYNRRGKPAELRMTLNTITGKKGFSYKVASLTYELQDKGLNKSHIVRELKVRPSRVYEAIEHRDVIEPLIIGMLRQRYPDKEVTKPYRTWK